MLSDTLLLEEKEIIEKYKEKRLSEIIKEEHPDLDILEALTVLKNMGAISDALYYYEKEMLKKEIIL